MSAIIFVCLPLGTAPSIGAAELLLTAGLPLPGAMQYGPSTPRSRVSDVLAKILYLGMRCALPDDRAAVPTARDAERPVPDARRTIDRGAEG